MHVGDFNVSGWTVPRIKALKSALAWLSQLLYRNLGVGLNKEPEGPYLMVLGNGAMNGVQEAILWSYFLHAPLGVLRFATLCALTFMEWLGVWFQHLRVKYLNIPRMAQRKSS